MKHPSNGRLVVSWTAVWVLSGWLALSLGCAPESNPSSETGEAATAGEEASLLHETKGLQLNEDSRVSLGIETGVVGPRTIHPSVALNLQVFAVETNAAGRERVRASAFIPAASDSLEPGQYLRVPIPQPGGNSITGAVIQVAREFKTALGRVEVIGEWEGDPGQFAVGLFLTAHLSRAAVQGARTVPVTAVVPAALGDFVYVMEGDYFKRVSVRRGVEDEQWIDIVEGLIAGQTVATRGAEDLWLLELSEVGGMTNLK